MKLIKVQEERGEKTSQIGNYRTRNGEEVQVGFHTQNPVAFPATNDHFFIVGALAAFLKCEPYHHLGSVSEELVSNFRNLMMQWSAWWKHHPITIIADTQASYNEPGPNRNAGCLMSGGVDSLFTAILPESQFGSFVNLIHCERRDSQAHLHRQHSELNSLASLLNKDLYFVETNIMTAFQEIEDAWSSVSHGPCMAAVGHFLSSELSSLCISASFSRAQQRPWGSHPETDKWLSSDSLEFKHTGIAFNRLEKHKLIAQKPELLKYLSVCENGPQTDGFINCSNCQKCLRSMITLDLLDFDRAMAPTFDWRDYHPKKLQRYLLQGAVNCTELLSFAEQIGRDDIAEILRDVIDYSDQHHWIVRCEMFVRRRFNWLLKYKTTLKRIRAAIYAILRIRTRRY